ncbi:MAG: hypothetical protein Q7T43_16425 [Rhodoferax sp.]|nr:hypothetical protein [Rhodoferax sp.]MDO8320757.1 hypothetical protein [Rhodoferax sp.]
MHGNVFEWVQDDFEGSYRGAHPQMGVPGRLGPPSVCYAVAPSAAAPGSPAPPAAATTPRQLRQLRLFLLNQDRAVKRLPLVSLPLYPLKKPQISEQARNARSTPAGCGAAPHSGCRMAARRILVKLAYSHSGICVSSY